MSKRGKVWPNFVILLSNLLINSIFFIPVIPTQLSRSSSYKEFFPFLFLVLISFLGILTLYLHTMHKHKREPKQQRESGDFRINKIDTIVLIFWLWLIIRSDLRYYFLPENALVMLSCILVYIYFRAYYAILNTNSGILFTIFSLLVVTLIIETGGLLQVLKVFPNENQYYSVSIFFNNPAPFCSFLTIAFPFAYSVYFKEFAKSVKVPGFKGLCLIISILTIFFAVFTFTRTALLSIVCTVAFFEWPKIVNWFKTRKNETRIIYYIAFLLLIFAGATLIFLLKYDSAIGRFLIWKNSFSMFKSSPVLGIGSGHFREMYNNFQAEYFKSNTGSALERKVASGNYAAFNEFLQTLVEQGIIGFTLLLLMSAMLFSASSNENRNLIILKSCKASYLSLLIFCSFSYPFSIVSFLLIFTILACCISSVSDNYFYNATKILGITMNTKSMAIVLIVLLSPIWFYNSIDKYLVYTNWSKSRILANHKKNLENLYPKLQDNGIFILEYAEHLNMIGKESEAIRILEKGKTRLPSTYLYTYLGDLYFKARQYERAENAYQWACYMIPSQFNTKYKLFRFYIKTNQPKMAILLAREITETPVKVKSLVVDVIKSQAKMYLNSRH